MSEPCYKNGCPGELLIELDEYSIRTPNGNLSYPMYVYKCNTCSSFHDLGSNVSLEVIMTIIEYNGILWKKM